MMATSTQAAPKKMLVLTICGYRKPGMGEEEFHHYMSEIHAPLVKDLLARHGITRYSMTHNTTATRDLLPRIRDAQFQNEAEYDIVTQIQFPDMQCFVDVRDDAFYKEKIVPDHDHFTDPERVFMTVGWVEDHIVNGEVVG